MAKKTNKAAQAIEGLKPNIRAPLESLLTEKEIAEIREAIEIIHAIPPRRRPSIQDVGRRLGEAYNIDKELGTWRKFLYSLGYPH